MLSETKRSTREPLAQLVRPHLLETVLIHDLSDISVVELGVGPEPGIVAAGVI